jgi:hemolysin D
MIGSIIGLMLVGVLARAQRGKSAALSMADRMRRGTSSTRDAPCSRIEASLTAAGSRATLSPLDREFLPAAMELVQTPAPPATIGFIWCICLGFSGALVWAFFGLLDIHAIAPGKIQPSGRSKIVQPFEPGRIAAVLVENGTRVNAGDILLELDATETLADQATQARELEATAAEVARRRIAIAIARSGHLEPRAIPFKGGTKEIQDRNDGVLAAEIRQLAATRDALKAQLEERAAQQQRLKMSIKARTELLTFLKERVDTRQAIDTQWQGYRGKVIDALQEYERERTNLAGEQGQLIEIDAAKHSLELKIDTVAVDFVLQQTEKLAEAERARTRLEQDLIKARSKHERTRLRAPIDGVVQQLSVTTVGQVVGSGQTLMTIVPLDASIEVEALVQNKDIGFVKVGQRVTVKVEAFPYTRYGTVDGTVTLISGDGVDEKTAGTLSDAAGVTRPQMPPSGSTAVQGLVFPARVALDRKTILVDGHEVKLQPGMAVTVEIRTGQRRAIDFLLAPLREIQASALRER